MPNTGEYKSTVGVDQLYYALITQDDENGYTCGTPAKLAPAANVSVEPNASNEPQYADNRPFDVMTGEGESKLTIDITALPIEVQATLLGKQFDAASGRVFDAGGEANPPDVALGFRSLKSNGSYRYYWYLKGKFTTPKDEAETKKEKKTPKNTQLMYMAINTTHLFDLGDGGAEKSQKRVYGDQDTTNFSETGWWSQVQTPETTAPDALALSSSVPVDNGTDISISADQTLTFNNALTDASVNGINLIDLSTGLPVATAVTLNTPKLVITVNPTADLSNNQEYLLVYSVTDIYGQTLNGVVSFTTIAA